MIEAFAVALAGTLLAQAAPGPNMVAVAAAGLAHGRGPALGVVGGIASGVLVWAAAVAFGLGALLAAAPGLLTALKILGGAYLLYLGGRGLRAALAGGLGAPTAPGPRTVPAARGVGAFWRLGLAVVLTNPKAALMWAAVASYLFGQGLTGAQVLAFGPVGAASAAAVYGTYAVLFSGGAAMRAYRRAGRWFEAAFGAVFGAMGAALALDGIRAASR